ncbi:hypothetical protein [Streptomyces sp. NRRL S-495]|uniref:hypothetical protein n=1 Tax=Streptomyces sp. NRRL S-495 TaxID=1609133 RepID=UPI000ADC7ACC|nr:hypothetical protein [Streptomyces sp. NRRL S-495]
MAQGQADLVSGIEVHGVTGPEGLCTAALRDGAPLPAPGEVAALLREHGYAGFEVCLVAPGVEPGWASELAARLGESVHVPAPGYVVADMRRGVRLKWADGADERADAWRSHPPHAGAVPRFADHQDRLLPRGLPPHLEPADGRSAMMTTAEVRDRLRRLLPAVPTSAYLGDHRLFDEAAHRVARRLRAGLPPLETEYRRLLGGVGRLVTRGVEIEFHAGHGARAADGTLLSTPQIDAIAVLLRARGLARDARVRQHGADRGPDGAEPYSEDRRTWRVELEEAEGDGEVVSPILRDTPQAYEDLVAVCAIIRGCGGRTSVRAGGHVHVGVPFGTDTALHAGHLARFQARQWLYFRLGTSIRAEAHRGTRFCQPLPGPPPVDATRIRQLRDDLKRRLEHPALKIARSVGRAGDSIEYRHGDASLDAAEWWTRAAAFAADVVLTVTADGHTTPPRAWAPVGDGRTVSDQTVLAARDGVQVYRPEPPGDTVEVRSMLDEYPWPRLRRHLAELYHLTPPYWRRRPDTDPAGLPVPYDVAALLGRHPDAPVDEESRRRLVAVLDHMHAVGAVSSETPETPAALRAHAVAAVGPGPEPVVELGRRLRAWDALTDEPDTPPRFEDLAALAAAGPEPLAALAGRPFVSTASIRTLLADAADGTGSPDGDACGTRASPGNSDKERSRNCEEFR